VSGGSEAGKPWTLKIGGGLEPRSLTEVYAYMMLTDFQNFFTDRFTSKYATKSSLGLTIPPHLKHVAELPCETSISENSENLMHAALSITNHKVM